MQRSSAAIAFLPLVLATPLTAQDRAGPWDSVAAVLGARSAEAGGTYRYSVPRTDLTVRIGSVAVEPGIALGSWAGFGLLGGDTVVMGDLVVTADELGHVQRQLTADGIAITAIHNHLVGESPPITYMHFMGMGSAIALARKVARALDLTGAPRPVRPGEARAVTIDTARVFRMLGARGSAEGPVAKLGFDFVEAPVTLGRHAVPPALATGSPLNIQAVAADRIVATGDFTVPASKVDPVLDALITHGITVTAVHSHLVGESPTLYYMHFWADGSYTEVLTGLRAAVDAGRT